MFDSKLSFLAQLPPFWHNLQEPSLLASGLRLLRNLQDFSFICKIEPQQKAKLLQTLLSALKALLCDTFLLLQAKEITGEEKEFLLERFPFLKGINQATEEELFLVDLSGRFLAILNLNEHLEIHFVAAGQQLEALLKTATAFDIQLGKTLRWAFHPRFGFLTSDPKLCGTALVGSVLLHLPALQQTNILDSILKKPAFSNICVDLSLSADLLLLENRQMIETTEEKLIYELQSAVSELVSAEKALYETLPIERQPFLMDKVARAFGLLRHSYLLENRESAQALSLLKMGLLVGWIEGLSLEEIDQKLVGHRNRREAGAEQSQRKESRTSGLHAWMQNARLLI